MISTRDPALADRVRLLRHHGQRDRYEHVELGYCTRLDNLQAAVLGVKLRHLDDWNAARRRAARVYDDLLDDRVVSIGRRRRGQDGVQYVYVVRIPGGKRDAVAASMRARGIDTGVHYPDALHTIPLFASPGQPSLPVAERAAAEVLSLPLYPEITGEQQEQVVQALLSALAA
jgi:dTDP-4-amino-4,6-dideoxygalactose transaminase